MSLKTIAGQDYEDVCVFQTDNGDIYVAMRDNDSPEPVELVGNPDTFTYGCDAQDSDSPIFKRIMRFYEVHDVSSRDVPVEDIRGWCKCFKFPHWEDYSFLDDNGVLFIVHTSLGTAKQWKNYSDMWDLKQVWRVIDQAANKTVDSIYAESAEEAVQQYLDRGANASLTNIIDDALGGF